MSVGKAITTAIPESDHMFTSSNLTTLCFAVFLVSSGYSQQQSLRTLQDEPAELVQVFPSSTKDQDTTDYVATR